MHPLDILLLAAYFGSMAVLSIYGLHRYVLVYLYYRHRHRAQRPAREAGASLPRVTVQLPVYNERFVVQELLDSICRLDYPRSRLQIQILDDSVDETRTVLRRAAAEWRERGVPVEYLYRKRRTGYKAGALQAALPAAQGGLIAIFDADFSPEPDFLRRVVPYFQDPRVGMVQARWTFRNRHKSLLTRLQGLLLDGHFIFEHGARARSGRFFNFNGTAGVLRKEAIEDAGGWSADTLTEDTDLSYRAQLRGWKFLYAQHVEVGSELPTDMASFQVQQYRWAKGLVQTGLKVLPGVFRSGEPLWIKAEAFWHLTANLSYPLMLLLAALLLPSMLVRHGTMEGRLLWLDLPAFLATFCSLSSFYTLAQWELGRGGVLRHLHMMPALVATGIGLAISNSRAALGALFGSRSEFERTAKYSSDPRTALKARKVYGLQGGWRVGANLAAAAYCAVCLGVAIHIGHWLGLPVVALFLAGFCYSAWAMLVQQRQRHRPILSVANEAAR